MSIELKQAAQQAIEAIQDLRGYRPDIDKAIEALRTAIQQAESEPCKSFTELRDRHREGVDAELAAMAAKTKTDEPVGVPSLIEKAISSGGFGVLPMKATIPMCKAGWGASGGELTFQELGHIYEEMYKARPLLDDAPPPTNPAPGVPDDAARYALLRERFNKQKMSACQRIVEDLGLEGDPLDGLDSLVDKDRFNAAPARKGGAA